MLLALERVNLTVFPPVVVKYAVPTVRDVVRSGVEPPEEKDLLGEETRIGQDGLPLPRTRDGEVLARDSMLPASTRAPREAHPAPPAPPGHVLTGASSSVRSGSTASEDRRAGSLRSWSR